MNSLAEITVYLKQYGNTLKGPSQMSKWSREKLRESLRNLGKSEEYISKYFLRHNLPLH